MHKRYVNANTDIHHTAESMLHWCQDWKKQKPWNNFVGYYLLSALSGDKNSTSACVWKASEVRRSAALLVDSKLCLGSRAELTAVFMPVQLSQSQRWFTIFYTLAFHLLSCTQHTRPKCGGSMFAADTLNCRTHMMMQYENGQCLPIVRWKAAMALNLHPET